MTDSERVELWFHHSSSCCFILYLYGYNFYPLFRIRSSENLLVYIENWKSIFRILIKTNALVGTRFWFTDFMVSIIIREAVAIKLKNRFNYQIKVSIFLMTIAMNSKFQNLKDLYKLKDQVKNLIEFLTLIQIICKIYFRHLVQTVNFLWKRFKIKCKNISKII